MASEMRIRGAAAGTAISGHSSYWRRAGNRIASRSVLRNMISTRNATETDGFHTKRRGAGSARTRRNEICMAHQIAHLDAI